jgi:hypothetical protein
MNRRSAIAGSAVRELLWGQRGVSKAAAVWLPLAVFAAADAPGALRPAWIPSLAVLAAVVCWSQVSILANDLNDSSEDRAAGKMRWICHLPGGAGALTVLLVACLGALVLCAAHAPARALGTYAIAVAAGVLYSAPPVRFKERGGTGVLAYGVATTLGYVALPWSWLGSGGGQLMVLAPAVLLDKAVNLLFHQVVDYDADRDHAVRTYAVQAGLDRSRRSLRRTARMAAAWLAGTWAYAASLSGGWTSAATGAGAAMAVAVYATIQRRRTAETSSLIREMPRSYLAMTFAAFRLLPLLMLALRAMADPRWLIVLGVAVGFLAGELRHYVRYRYA